jgi:hypothetical protein
MLSKEFLEMMKNDKELEELRKRVYAITGRLEDISFRVGANYTYEEWKEQLRKIEREYLEK